MAMVVKNNQLATMSLGELNKNIVEKGKRMTRLATGQKIVGASDGASEFSITEKMQVQLRSLGQDIENTRTGRSMLSVGAGGIEKIVEELRGMKQLAINAANDTNTDADRATIQKEFDQKKQDIADIVSSTNYNGKLLLDGTYARKHHGVTQTSGDGSSETPISPYGPRGAQAVLTRPFTGIERDWENDTRVVNGVRTIDQGGAYTIPSGFSGTINITNLAAAAGVKLSGAGALNNVNIVVEDTATGADLWIDGLNITNGTDESIIQFTGSNNTLTLLGSNTLTQNRASAQAVVDMGGGLTVQGNGSSLSISNRGGQGACIGSDASVNSGGDLQVVDAILDLNANIGAVIGAGAGGATIGNVVVKNSTVNLTGGTFGGIGSGRSSTCGDILIQQSTIYDLPHDGYGYSPYGSIDTCIGAGYLNGKCGTITIEGTVVHAINRDSAIIGAGDAGGRCSDIIISNSDIETASVFGAGIGSGRGGHAGNIYIKNETKVKHEALVNADNDEGVRLGAAIGSGYGGDGEATVGNIFISPSSKALLDTTLSYIDPEHAIPGVGKGYLSSAGSVSGVSDIGDDVPQEPGEWVETDFEGTPLIIHTGTKANQHMRCYIEDLGLDALGLGKDDNGVEKVSLLTREDAQLALGEMCEANWNLEDPNYASATAEQRNNPDNYLGPIDKAINYALGEATQLGAYMSRLEQTQANLTINQENTTSAQSTIRDADMAQEMTAMVKANILSQSSQAMLAQANQISSNVLDLLG
ncbi:flagellin [Selenomonas sp. AE3005]|uniref:flagellin N-terminal helical domain-containing protein n=1 Tax=Selenomonas sp. AE3005 TaxID=1485543 RepID=UPI0025F75DC4|nr:flagellin [Selenomonas sp. AE3005]